MNLAIKGISFYGEQHAGKTECAKYVEAMYGARRVEFADPLKYRVAAMLTSVPERRHHKPFRHHIHAMNGTPEEKAPYRKLMQAVGAYYRGLDVDYWVKLHWQAAVEAVGYAALVVSSDARHQNEHDRYVDNDLGRFIFVKVERPGVKPSKEAADDESEVAWRSWEPDHVIVNDGTLDDLHEQINVIVAGYEAEDTVDETAVHEDVAEPEPA